MWQILVLFYLIFGTASYLLRRKLAERVPEHNRIINVVFFILFLLPSIPILLPFFPHDLNVGWENFAMLLFGSILFPIVYIVSYKASEKVEAGIFTIINNLTPVFTIFIAVSFLGENLSRAQFFGAGLIIFSGVIAPLASVRGKSKISMQALGLCLASAGILGIAFAFERYMLTRVDFGAYLVYGWGAQIFWSVVFAYKELKTLPSVLSKSSGIRSMVLSWGAVSLIRSVCFVVALSISTASIISSTTNFLSVAVVIGAYFFLSERENIPQKILAVAIGILGLFLITS